MPNRLQPYDNAEVVFGDIMESQDLNELLTPRRIGQNGNILPVSVCANLPYYITTPILMRLVESFADFDYITVMVQKEVASRLYCASGKRGIRQYYCFSRLVRRLQEVIRRAVRMLLSAPEGRQRYCALKTA